MIALTAVAVTVGISQTAGIVRIREGRTCKSRCMDHVRSFLVISIFAIIEIVVIHRKVFVCMTRKEGDIRIIYEHLLELCVISLVRIHKAAVIRIIQIISCAEASDRRMLYEENVPAAIILINDRFCPVYLCLGKDIFFIRCSFLQCHKVKRKISPVFFSTM